MLPGARKLRKVAQAVSPAFPETRAFRLGLFSLAAVALLSFGVTAAAQVTATAPGGPIPSNLPATSGVVTSDIVITTPGYVASGNAITVTLLGLQHDFSGDLQINLSFISSTGANLQSVDILNRVGATTANPYGSSADFGNNNGSGDNYQFNTDFTGNLWTAAACADPPACTEPLGDADSLPGVSTDKTNNGQYFTSTTSGTKTNLSYAFTGINIAGGTWRLTITDSADPNFGSFVGWQISIATVANPTPVSLTASAGTPQSATISTSFASVLQAKVTDAYANPVPGISVTFTAPSSGASATFSGSTSAIAVTNSSGIAISPVPLANATAGSYSVTASATGLTSATFRLTNAAVTTAPAVTLSPTSLTFASQSVGVSSSQTVTVTNSGNAPLTITSVQLTGTNSADYSTANGCTATVAAGSSCNISVTFTPSAVGTRTATLSLTDNAANSAQTAAITGTGSSVAAPTTFTTYVGPYGSAFPNYTAASVTLPLRAYVPSGVSQLYYMFADFNATSGGAVEYQVLVLSDGAGGYNMRLQGSSVTTFVPLTPSGATVTLTTPLILGTVSATAYRFAIVGNEFQLDLTLSHSGSFSDQVAILATLTNGSYSSPWNTADAQWSSTAASTPGITLSSSALSFASQVVGTTTTQTLTITSSGSSPLSIASAQISGTNASDFSINSNTCTSASISPGSTCSIAVSFTPAATGTRSATLSINDNVTGPPQTVSLSGTGGSVAPPTTFTTYMGTYGSAFPTYNAATVTLPLRAYIPAGASQLYYMYADFNATSGAAIEYQALVLSDGTGGYNMRLQGSSTTAFISLTPTGSTVTLTTPLVLGSVSATAYRFALAGNEFQLDLTLTRSGTFSDQVAILAVQNNGAYSAPWNVANGQWSSAAANSPGITLSSIALTFAPQVVGTTTSQTVNITSSGSANLSISSAQIAGTNAGDFTITSNTCTSSLSPGSTCAIAVSFDPAATGARSATLSINDNVTGSPQSVALNGIGSSNAGPTTFTTYMGTYGSAFPTYSGTSVTLPFRAYLPTGASQLYYMFADFNTTSSGAIEYQLLVLSDGSGGYNMRLQSSSASAFIPLSPSGSTVTLTTPLSFGNTAITAYRFALAGNEFQLDVSLTRAGTFDNQVVILAIQNNGSYSAPWNASNAHWTNP